jgi:methyl-accepting chemotaxis protein
MHRAIRILLFLLFAASWCPGITEGQQASPSPSPSASATKPEATPIPLVKVPLEAETTVAALQEINARASKEQSAGDLIGANLSTLASEIEARGADDSRLQASSQSLDTLSRMMSTWGKLGEDLSASTRELAQCANTLDQDIARLDQLQNIWQSTLQSAKQPETPPAVWQRVQSTQEAIAFARKTAESSRANVLTVQTRLSEAQARVRTALTSVEQLQTNALKSLAVRDSPPIWQIGASLGD